MARKLFSGKTTGSKSLVGIMTKYGLAIEDICLAVLIASGIPDIDALRVVYKVQAASDTKASAYYNKLLSERPQLAKYIADLNKGKVSSADGSDKRDLRTKSGMLDALEEAARETDDAKQRADIYIKMADLQRMKNDEDTEKESYVHYYLPLRCDQCPYRPADDVDTRD